MKTHLKQLIRTGLKGMGMAAAAVLVAGSVQTSQAGVSADPSGDGSFTWDLQSSGAGQRGLALITFNSDLTFRGYQMLAAIPPKNKAASGNEGRGGDEGRGDSGGGVAGQTNHFLFGFSPIEGVWARNSRGQIVGFFNEAINVTSLVTNYLATSLSTNIVNSQGFETTNLNVTFTNGQATLSTNFAWATPIPGHTDLYVLQNPNFTVAIGSAESTNRVSFTGKSVFKKRLDLVCSTSFGKVTYKGKEAVTSLDLTGNWIGTKRVNGVEGNVFFSLTSFAVTNAFPVDFPDIASFPNVFFTQDGIDPLGTFSGVAMFSQRKTVGFVFYNDDGTLRSASVGTLKATKHGPTATTTGIEKPFSLLNFSATLQ